MSRMKEKLCIFDNNRMVINVENSLKSKKAKCINHIRHKINDLIYIARRKGKQRERARCIKYVTITKRKKA